MLRCSRFASVCKIFLKRIKRLIKPLCEPNNHFVFLQHLKKGKGKVQGVPQSQTAALPRHQKEEETDKTKQAQIKQTYEKHRDLNIG